MDVYICVCAFTRIYLRTFEDILFVYLLICSCAAAVAVSESLWMQDTNRPELPRWTSEEDYAHWQPRGGVSGASYGAAGDGARAHCGDLVHTHSHASAGAANLPAAVSCGDAYDASHAAYGYAFATHSHTRWRGMWNDPYLGDC